MWFLLISYSQINQFDWQLDSLSPHPEHVVCLCRELILFIVHQFFLCQQGAGRAVESMDAITFHWM